MSHAQQIISNEPSVPAAKGTVGDVGSQTSYNPGLSYLVGPALYGVMKMWSEISILIQRVVSTVTSAEATTSLDAANQEIEQGKELKSQAYATGISQAIGGGLTAGVGLAGAASTRLDSQLKGFEAEKEGIEGYQGTLQGVMERGSAGGISEEEAGLKIPVDEQMNELMTQREFAGRTPSTSDQIMMDEKGVARMSDKTVMEQADARDQVKLKEEYNRKLDKANENIQRRRGELSNRNRNMLDAATAIGQMSQGAGTTIGGGYQLDAKEAEAKETVAKTSQTILGGLDSTFRGQVEKMVEAALQIISTLASISHANKANS